MIRAAVTAGPGRLAIEDRPVPELEAGDVLAAVELCGICGSDLHMVLEGWAGPGRVEGHEWVGRVVAVGEGVTRWSVGDAVVGGPWERCGTCGPCRAGRPSLCDQRDAPGSEYDGAFATHKRAREGELLALPDGLDPRAAALAEPLAVALHALDNAGDLAGRRLLVLGAGPIGVLAIAAARAAGAAEITCVEPTAARRELAVTAGADRVLVPEDLDVPSVAEPGRTVADAVDIVLECSGKASAMEAGLAQLVPAGTLVLVGAGIEPPRFDPNRILLNEVVVTGAYTYGPGGFERALALLGSGAVPVDALVEPGTVPLDGMLDAMRDLAAGRIAGKVLVQP